MPILRASCSVNLATGSEMTDVYKTSTYSKNLVSNLALHSDQDQGSVFSSMVGDIMWVLASRFWPYRER